MNFLPDELDQYVANHTSKEPAILNELSRETWEKVLNPRMLSGHLQGRVLSFLTKILQPKNILEIGTFTGYSTLCFAEGLNKEGCIDTIDINEELEPITRKYFEKSGLIDKITQHFGNAIEIIPSLNKSYDLIFIDADKSNYLKYYHLVIDKLNKGGVIIVDNVLWNGKVIQEVKENDEDTKIIIELNNFINNDSRVENVLFPIRDGMMMVRKL